MFSTIVIGTDGSPDAERALEVAADLARAGGDTALHVVTAFRSLTPGELATIADGLPEEYRLVLHSRMTPESRLAEARRLLELRSADAHYHDIDDDPTDALLDVVEETGADLLVVGSRGEGAAKRLLHGSVSTKVLHNAPCAVLVVKAER